MRGNEYTTYLWAQMEIFWKKKKRRRKKKKAWSVSAADKELERDQATQIVLPRSLSAPTHPQPPPTPWADHRIM